MSTSTGEGGRPLVDGRFELVSRLGSGGMGTVWRARDVTLDREVALKEVRPPDRAAEEADPGLTAQLRRRAVQEAKALARLSTPHVVTIHQIVEPPDGSHPWIVMELVEGRSVYDRLADGPMPVPEVITLGLEVLSALRAAHSAGVHHRDVKPANVLLRPDGSAVLTDFGIAVLSGATSRLTSTGDLIGSPEYIAPERVRGEEGNPASDLWSLGMLLYVAAEGHHPFRRATGLATVVAVLDDPVPPPVRSGALGPVLDQLLVRDPARRPDGARLERLLRQAQYAASPQGPHATAWTPQDAVPGGTSVPGGASVPGGRSVPGGASVPGGVFGPPVPPLPAAPPARRPARRRAVAVSAALAVTVALAAVAALNWPPGGGSADRGKNGTGTSPSTSGPRTPGPATPGTGTPATDTPGTGSSGSNGGGTAPRGSLLTEANVRAVLASFREASGNPQVKEVTFYEDYALAAIPTKPGAKTYDAYQYRDGVARRTGPGGTIASGSADDQPFDATTLAWSGLPALMKRAERELKVDDPNLRYVIVDRWTFNDDRPTLRVYLSNEYLASGYLAADTRGQVVASHPAS
ncbi:serine/threonine-protein kinase [Streptomyces ficellus]|uniref:non-specific serine/threonine protein kinase n=1 Tax=Streptomyces ficellus TaxID=1977088 RepID=A0A6I6F042_9ACTN|nr:serine/threonine-protein kinase [Streptomyces ficellus]QGV77060.1 serine/threonine protein kinase [Streptomyces ficellus]